MIDSSQITMVFQGSIKPELLGSGHDNGSDFLYNVAQTRRAYPNARIILSTWADIVLPESYNSAEKMGIDALIQSPDPGGLPNIKFGYDDPNNVNRQIISSKAGLDAVTTPYAIKMRTDSFLVAGGLPKIYQDYQREVQSSPAADTVKSAYSPIMVPHLFTIDPSVFEHMAYHVSDWAQFGETKTLQEYWSVEPMRWEDACYFEFNQHNPNASYGNDAFRTRLAVEQHITTRFAQTRGFATPIQYNHITDDILQGHRDFLAKHIIVLNTADFGLALPKYAWAQEDWFMRLNCLNHDDWYALFSQYWQLRTPDTERLANAAARHQEKNLAHEDFEEKLEYERARILSKLYP